MQGEAVPSRPASGHWRLRDGIVLLPTFFSFFLLSRWHRRRPGNVTAEGDLDFSRGFPSFLFGVDETSDFETDVSALPPPPLKLTLLRSGSAAQKGHEPGADEGGRI